MDLGTGSGAIALALATEVPHARVFAAENSVDAFIWTRENFDRTGADNATLAFVDLEHAFPELDGTVSVVVSASRVPSTSMKAAAGGRSKVGQHTSGLSRRGHPAPEGPRAARRLRERPGGPKHMDVRRRSRGEGLGR